MVSLVRLHLHVVPQGEASKCFPQLEEILRDLSDRRFSRSDTIVALGGGVTGDMMDMSRALQYSLIGGGGELRETIQAAGAAPEKSDKIACLGENGSFSHEALGLLYPKAAPQFYQGFGGIFAAVANGDADLGILPVENSSAGSVSEVYDLILKYRFYIVAATSLHVHQCLAAAKKVDVRSIGTVYSHPQALSQCSDYIAKNDLRALPCSNTAMTCSDCTVISPCAISPVAGIIGIWPLR